MYNCLPWHRELAAYDTIEKCLDLARAMEIDSARIKNHLFTLDLYQECKANNKWPDDISYDDLVATVIDSFHYDLMDAIRVRREKRKLEKLIFGETGNRHWFVTIGLDDSQFTEDNEAMLINPLVARIRSTPDIENVKFVVEKFRRTEDGKSIYVHRHIHFVFDSNKRKSKVIEFCYRKAKKLVKGPNFVDVKPDPDRARDKYIMGDKVKEKMECVEKDRIWRKEKKIIECE